MLVIDSNIRTLKVKTYQLTNIRYAFSSIIIYHRLEKNSVLKKPRLSEVTKHGCFVFQSFSRTFILFLEKNNF